MLSNSQITSNVLGVPVLWAGEMFKLGSLARVQYQLLAHNQREYSMTYCTYLCKSNNANVDTSWRSAITSPHDAI